MDDNTAAVLRSALGIHGHALWRHAVVLSTNGMGWLIWLRWGHRSGSEGSCLVMVDVDMKGNKMCNACIILFLSQRQRHNTKKNGELKKPCAF